MEVDGLPKDIVWLLVREVEHCRRKFNIPKDKTLTEYVTEQLERIEKLKALIHQLNEDSSPQA